MTETARIADQIHRSLHGPAWHGPALFEALDGVTAALAAAPRSGAHSIWEITGHVTTWIEVVGERLTGKVITEIPDDRNFPPVTDASVEAWRATLERLRRSAARFGDAVAALSPSRFDDPLPGVEQDWTVYQSLHGIVQHVIYHAGQIALLRKQ